MCVWDGAICWSYIEWFQVEIDLFIYWCNLCRVQVSFLLTLATNYQRIKNSQELTEYRNAVDLELTDTTMLESRKHYDWETVEVRYDRTARNAWRYLQTEKLHYDHTADTFPDSCSLKNFILFNHVDSGFRSFTYANVITMRLFLSKKLFKTFKGNNCGTSGDYQWQHSNILLRKYFIRKLLLYIQDCAVLIVD